MSPTDPNVVKPEGRNADYVIYEMLHNDFVEHRKEMESKFDAHAGDVKSKVKGLYDKLEQIQKDWKDGCEAGHILRTRFDAHEAQEDRRKKESEKNDDNDDVIDRRLKFVAKFKNASVGFGLGAGLIVGPPLTVLTYFWACSHFNGM